MFLKILTLLTLPIILTACASESPPRELDIQAFSEEVLDVITVDDELVVLSADVAADFYDIEFEGLLEYVIITSGTRATATEVAVFKLEDKVAVGGATASIDKRLEDQLATYRDYRPDQVEYIENALIHIMGTDKYVLLSLTPDNDAVQKLFEESFK